MAKLTPTSEYELLAHFEAVRAVLLQRSDETESNRTELSKPLAFWALPGDRRLPLAFMSKTLGELLLTPFQELYATPGVGRKKIRALVTLLGRISQSNPLMPSPHALDGATAAAPPGSGQIPSVANLSEASWAQWCAMIRDHALGSEPLGRYAASLENLPRVIWTTPLAAYLDLSLAEMRALKTYGPKRVTAVLEIFASLRTILAAVDEEPHLAIRIGCHFAHDIEDWIQGVVADNHAPDYREIRTKLVEPLIRQLEVDAGNQIAHLAESRLALRETDTSVRHVAQNMDRTSARIYQLTDAIRTILQVRWPDGSTQLRMLHTLLDSVPAESDAIKLFQSAADFFFPASRRTRKRSMHLAADGREGVPTVYRLPPD